MSDQAAGRRPLAGVGVVEWGGDVAVRYCGRLFARLGANVWRASDGERRLDPAYAAWLDQGKIAAASPEAALAAMARAAPQRRLVIAGQTPAEIARAEARLAASPDAPPLLALTWFDPRGAYADWHGDDPILHAMTGVAFGFGETAGPPTLSQGCSPQVVGGVTAFIAGLGALIGVTQPAKIEANIFEAALCFTETGAVSAAALGFESRRLGVNRFSPSWPCGIYRAADGYVGVTALTYPQWSAFARLIGRDDLAADPGLRASLLRLAAADALDPMLAEIMPRHPVAYWVEQGDALRIPITPANPPRELPGLAHWRARDSFEPMPSGAEAPTLPFRFVFDGERRAPLSGGPEGPLSGVRVADFTMGWAGPLAARYLGDLGADVLKIESHVRRDWWRGWDPSPEVDPPPYELPRNFMAVNRSKRGLDLDLAAPADRAAAEAIVRRADLVIDNQGPGVMDKLGLGPADQRRLNPGAVSVTMPPFGAGGPLSGLRAYGSTVEQASGMPFINGCAGWLPAQQHVAYGDPVAGLYAAAAALVGLYARERLGASRIEVCQVECLFQLGADAIIGEQVAGRPWPRTGSRRPDMAPCCVVRGAGDGESWLAVTADTDTAWRSLAGAIGRPDLADDPALGALAGRKAREDEIEAAIAAWAADRDPRSAAEALQAAGVPAAAVAPVHELFADPHLQDCGYWAVQDRRYVGVHFTPQPPFRYDGERPPIGRPAPTLGEHTEAVLAELGIARERG